MILGSTGTIGVNTLSVIDQQQDYKPLALTAGYNLSRFRKQLKKYMPQYAAMLRKKDCDILSKEFPKITFYSGDEGIQKIAALPIDALVISAIVGFAGFLPTYHALKSGKQVALANKESLVAGGIFLKPFLKKPSQILPLDSEHSAIFQLLKGHTMDQIEDVVLTASGGPFWNTPQEQLKTIAVSDALNHPNWAMGNKITIDSSTMINKVFEVIETHYLFDLPPEKIRITIHPSSLVHSLISFNDGVMFAQMSPPDMRIPIAYALNYPHHTALPFGRLDLSKTLNLSFYPPNHQKFPALNFIDRFFQEPDRGVVLNGANEVAVTQFLSGNIPWNKIVDLVRYVWDNFPIMTPNTPEDLLNIHQKVIIYSNEVVQKNNF